MKKFLKSNSLVILFSLLLAVSFLAAPLTGVESATILENLGKTAADPFNAPETGVTTTTPGQLVGQIIQIILGFTGTVAFVIFLYGGFLWMTARGSEEQVTKAKKHLTNGAIGTIVIILAYSATYFITQQLYYAI